MLDEIGLDVYEYRLMGHYIRRGMTYEGSKETGRICNMSRRQVIKKRQSLESRGLIHTWLLSKAELMQRGWKIPRDAPEGDYRVVKPVDHWDRNLAHFENRKQAPDWKERRRLDNEIRDEFGVKS
ncbi:MAG: hypothetical protein M1570_18595 [Chloroflexi bacterium]|nr:hypothetical protein [Chloroflexota bacterium]